MASLALPACCSATEPSAEDTRGRKHRYGHGYRESRSVQSCKPTCAVPPFAGAGVALVNGACTGWSCPPWSGTRVPMARWLL